MQPEVMTEALLSPHLGRVLPCESLCSGGQPAANLQPGGGTMTAALQQG